MHTWDTVATNGVELTNTMPMHGSSIILQIVVYSDFEKVSPDALSMSLQKYFVTVLTSSQ